MNGVWKPKRTPVPALAIGALGENSKSAFLGRFSKPTEVQRHLWVAAARGESLVVVAPRHSGGQTGLHFANEVLAQRDVPGTLSLTDGPSPRRAGLRGPDITLVVVEPQRDASRFAEQIAIERGRCGFVDVTAYETVRTRVFAPFRDNPTPREESLLPAFGEELARMRSQNIRVAVVESDDATMFDYGVNSCVIRGGSRHSARVARLATATDGPEHAQPELVLFARSYRELLLAHVVADRVRRGQLDAECSGAGAETSRVVEKWEEQIAADTSPSERIAYRLVAGLAMSRGHAMAILNGVRAAALRS